nr:hypothetical protein [uncultured Rhodopila sp.]
MTLADRLIDLNRWYEGLPDGRRVFVYPAVLVGAGFINTRLTDAPIGWVSLSALVALVVIRRSYISGWLASRAPIGGAVPGTLNRAVGETVTPAAAAKPESIQRVVADVPEADPVVPVAIVAEREVSEPAAPPSARAAEPVAVQPNGRAAAEEVVPVEETPLANLVKAATATPPAPVRESHGKTGKRAAASSSRKAEGKSGKRKRGDKHPH